MQRINRERAEKSKRKGTENEEKGARKQGERKLERLPARSAAHPLWNHPKRSHKKSKSA